jgi:hypothetical protein
MPYWWFYDYITDQHRCPILDWWGLQDAYVQAAFDLLVKTLSETEDWEAVESSKRKHRVLTKQHAGICELVFEVKGFGKYRALGLWRPHRRDFVFFGACRKRMKPFGTVPPHAFERAYGLMRQFQEGKGDIRDHV